MYHQTPSVAARNSTQEKSHGAQTGNSVGCCAHNQDSVPPIASVAARPMTSSRSKPELAVTARPAVSILCRAYAPAPPDRSVTCIENGPCFVHPPRTQKGRRTSALRPAAPIADDDGETYRAWDETSASFDRMKRSVMAGPVPAKLCQHQRWLQMAGTSPAVTDRFIRSDDALVFVPRLTGE